MDAGAEARERNRAMSDGSTLSLPEIEDRIAIVRDNIRQLTEQAAAVSGAGTEALLADRISSQQAELDRLIAERDALLAKLPKAAPKAVAAPKKKPAKKTAKKKVVKVTKKKVAPKAAKKKAAAKKVAKKSVKTTKKAAKKKVGKKKRK
jgi:uncharacterized small protein (DUF1192 family)